jgi:HK97 family phage major capsid protein
MTIELVMKQVDAIEASMTAFQERAGEEVKASGKASQDTVTALDKLGEQQREIADRMLSIEQSGGGTHGGGETVASMGKQFTNSTPYANFISGSSQKARFEVQNNTLTGSDANVAPDRKPGIVPGDSQILTLESIFPSIPTSSNAIEYTKEDSFTNSAAEVAEGGTKAQSALTWALGTMPVSTIAHWLKISRQLADDAPALAAYVNLRMIYGVNRRVETQLGAGNGTAPNISGILDTGNFTAHGFADAALGSTMKKFALVRKIIASLRSSGFMADAVLLHPADAAQIDIDHFQASTNAARFTTDGMGQARLFGLPVIESNGVTEGQVVVGAFMECGTIHNREGVVVEMSDSDDDNFTKNLVTIRAERRLALTIERPSGIIAGDLAPS